MKKLQTKCFEFLWANKRDKIKRYTMYNTPDLGGLSVPNIELFCKSLKLSWIKRLLNEGGGQWKTLFATLTEKIGGYYMLQVSNKKPSFIEKLNPFWRDVYNAWQTLKYQGDEEEYCNEPRIQPLFFNPQILLNQQPFFNAKWRLCGATHINDLLKENGNFYSYDEFIDFYGPEVKETTSFISYMAVIKAIPSEWKRIIREKGGRLGDYPHTKSIDMIINLAKPSRFFYAKAISSTATSPSKAFKKWESSLGISPEEADWPQAFTLQSKASGETRLRALQLKIIHRILPTNKLLFKYKIKSTQSCTFCSIYNESLEHLFWEFCKNIVASACRLATSM